MSARVFVASVLAIAITACYGPGRITYIDSSRAQEGRVVEQSVDGNASRTCGSAGISRIVTRTPYTAALLRSGARDATITCGRAP
ncbi:MAG TPA: hypothetical protein VM513_16800 [Kofleriaceae bacterium]|jgi:hypothetical protein|nr:hypothetical protein [Kofleriaceae bacterium]